MEKSGMAAMMTLSIQTHIKKTYMSRGHSSKTEMILIILNKRIHSPRTMAIKIDGNEAVKLPKGIKRETQGGTKFSPMNSTSVLLKMREWSVTMISYQSRLFSCAS